MAVLTYNQIINHSFSIVIAAIYIPLQFADYLIKFGVTFFYAQGKYKRQGIVDTYYRPFVYILMCLCFGSFIGIVLYYTPTYYQEK